MRALRAEAHVAGAQDDRAIGQAQRLEDALGAAGHPVELGPAVLGTHDRDHLDLLELVLAQHPGGVLARAPGLGAEALGVRGHADRQRPRFQDLARDGVGQRHLGSRDQPPAIGGLVAVFGEFRQLAGAQHRLVAHQHRGPGLGQAVLLDMGVEHELRQRPMQPDHRAAHHHEARARELCGGGEIEPGHGARDLEMLLRREVEAARLAPALDLDIVGLVGAVRHVVERQVGQGQQHLLHLRLLDAGLFLQLRLLLLLVGHQLAQALELGLVAAGLGGAHFLAGAVALGLGGLGFGNGLASAGVQRQDVLGPALLAAARQGTVEGIGILPDQANVMHGNSPIAALNRSRGSMAYLAMVKKLSARPIVRNRGFQTGVARLGPGGLAKGPEAQ